MSLSVPLPASPDETQHNRESKTIKLPKPKFSSAACQLRTHVFHSCDLVSHQVHILPANINTENYFINFFSVTQQKQNKCIV